MASEMTTEKIIMQKVDEEWIMLTFKMFINSNFFKRIFSIAVVLIIMLGNLSMLVSADQLHPYIVSWNNFVERVDGLEEGQATAHKVVKDLGGGKFEIGLYVAGRNATQRSFGADIVYVIDTSGSMSTEDIAAARNAVVSSISELFNDPEMGNKSRAAVVVYNEWATCANFGRGNSEVPIRYWTTKDTWTSNPPGSSLTDKERISTVANELLAGGNFWNTQNRTATQLGIHAAQWLFAQSSLVEGSPNPAKPIPPGISEAEDVNTNNKVMVIMTDGAPNKRFVGKNESHFTWHTASYDGRLDDSKVLLETMPPPRSDTFNIKNFAMTNNVNGDVESGRSAVAQARYAAETQGIRIHAIGYGKFFADRNSVAYKTLIGLGTFYEANQANDSLEIIMNGITKTAAIRLNEIEIVDQIGKGFELVDMTGSEIAPISSPKAFDVNYLDWGPLTDNVSEVNRAVVGNQVNWHLGTVEDWLLYRLIYRLDIKPSDDETYYTNFNYTSENITFVEVAGTGTGFHNGNHNKLTYVFDAHPTREVILHSSGWYRRQFGSIVIKKELLDIDYVPIPNGGNDKGFVIQLWDADDNSGTPIQSDTLNPGQSISFEDLILGKRYRLQGSNSDSNYEHVKYRGVESDGTFILTAKKDSIEATTINKKIGGYDGSIIVQKIAKAETSHDERSEDRVENPAYPLERFNESTLNDINRDDSVLNGNYTDDIKRDDTYTDDNGRNDVYTNDNEHNDDSGPNNIHEYDNDLNKFNDDKLSNPDLSENENMSSAGRTRSVNQSLDSSGLSEPIEGKSFNIGLVRILEEGNSKFYGFKSVTTDSNGEGFTEAFSDLPNGRYKLFIQDGDGFSKEYIPPIITVSGDAVNAQIISTIRSAMYYGAIFVEKAGEAFEENHEFYILLSTTEDEPIRIAGPVRRGEIAEFRGLAPGSYKISESIDKNEHYANDYTYAEPVLVTIGANELSEHHVRLVNRPNKPQDIKVTKQVTAAVLEPSTFYFDLFVADNDGSKVGGAIATQPITLNPGDTDQSVTFYSPEKGEYVIVEHYNPEFVAVGDRERSVKINRSDSESQQVTFINTRSEAMVTSPGGNRPVPDDTEGSPEQEEYERGFFRQSVGPVTYNVPIVERNDNIEIAPEPVPLGNTDVTDNSEIFQIENKEIPLAQAPVTEAEVPVPEGENTDIITIESEPIPLGAPEEKENPRTGGQESQDNDEMMYLVGILVIGMLVIMRLGKNSERK